MGLLDDAIREHLELKRRRGADPGEVAREQHEALDPVERQRVADSEDDAAFEQMPHGGDDGFDLPDADVMAGGVPEDLPDDLADAPRAPRHAAAIGVDETAEFDMRTVLGDDLTTSGEDAALGTGVGAAPAAGAAHGRDTPPPVDDSLEWEVPRSEASAEPDERKPGEDVLEETPDFLRETPEQDRLWFEQRPPRDFDFDK